MFKSLFKKKPSKNPVKPIIKPITEFPAKILIIDNTNFKEYQSTGYHLHHYFSQEIDNNLYKFDFACNFRHTLKQVPVIRPDLILCELVIPPIESVAYKYQTRPSINSLDFYLESQGIGHGLKIFEVLEMLDLDYTIPVIFWAILAEDYKNEAMKLGAIDCIKRAPKEHRINQSIKKALGIPEKSDLTETPSQASSSINNLQDKTKQAKKKPGFYQKVKTQGIKQGQASLILLQLKKRIGEIKSEDENRITELEIQQLEALGLALLDFSNYDDLIAWLANN